MLDDRPLSPAADEIHPSRRWLSGRRLWMVAAAIIVLTLAGLALVVWPRPVKPGTTVTLTETAAPQAPGCPATWTTPAAGGWHGGGPTQGLQHQLVGHLVVGVHTRDWLEQQHRYTPGARFTSGTVTMVLVPLNVPLNCF